MNKILITIVLALFLTSCGSSNDNDKETSIEPSKEVEIIEEEIKEIEIVEEEIEVVEAEIDTSMYEYAENVAVTDALEINNHITLMIDMSENTKTGLAFQHVVNQTYEFLKQDSAKVATTIGINVRQGETKTAMFTVYPANFKEDDDIPMSDLVLKASVVNMAVPEVEDYAKIMELNLIKE